MQPLQTAAAALRMEIGQLEFASQRTSSPPSLGGRASRMVVVSGLIPATIPNATTSLRWRPAIAFLPFILSVFFSTDGGLISYGVDYAEIFAMPQNTSIAFCAAKSRPTCRCSCRPNSSWSSISRPPRRSASQCPTGCSRSPTR